MALLTIVLEGVIGKVMNVTASRPCFDHIFYHILTRDFISLADKQLTLKSLCQLSNGGPFWDWPNNFNYFLIFVFGYGIAAAEEHGLKDLLQSNCGVF